MTRLDQLVNLRERVNAEIARERAYRKRVELLSRDVSAAMTNPATIGHRVLDEVTTVFDVTVGEILSSSRHRDVVHARQVAAWLLRAGGLSSPQIGRILGRDHTTVLYGVNRVEADPVLRKVAGELLDAGNDLGGVA